MKKKNTAFFIHMMLIRSIFDGKTQQFASLEAHQFSFSTGRHISRLQAL
jgi:hypothetical protein